MVSAACGDWNSEGGPVGFRRARADWAPEGVFAPQRNRGGGSEESGFRKALRLAQPAEQTLSTHRPPTWTRRGQIEWRLPLSPRQRWLRKALRWTYLGPSSSVRDRESYTRQPLLGCGVSLFLPSPTRVESPTGSRSAARRSHREQEGCWRWSANRSGWVWPSSHKDLLHEFVLILNTVFMRFWQPE